MKRSSSFSLLLILIPTLLLAAAPPPPYTAAILIEPTTGRVLFEKNSNQSLPPASMTKMMTLLIVREAIKDGTLTWETPVTVSARASKMGGSQVFLKQGAVYKVRELAAATMIHSANDAAMSLAEHVGGTAESFVNIMNQRAGDMGFKNTKYVTPHGLPGRAGEPDDLMSPLELAKLGIELMKYPEMRQWAVMQTMPFKSGTFELMYNPNHLLRNYPGATGIKTGYHGKAGFCVTGSARRGNMDLVVVVMGSQIKKDNFQSAANILSEGFANYRMHEAVKKGTVLQQPAMVSGGQTATVRVMAGDSARTLIKRGEEKGFQVEWAGTALQAPVRKGQPAGTIVVKQDGRVISKVPAIAATDVAKEPWWKRFWPF